MNVARWLLNLLPAMAAILAVVAIPLWILGVPGVRENDYARGWGIGLQAILAYPVIFVGLVLFRWIVRKWVPASAGALDVLIWAAFFAFVIAQTFAWYLILR